MKRLLRADNEAVSVKWEVITEQELNANKVLLNIYKYCSRSPGAFLKCFYSSQSKNWTQTRYCLIFINIVAIARELFWKWALLFTEYTSVGKREPKLRIAAPAPFFLSNTWRNFFELKSWLLKTEEPWFSRYLIKLFGSEPDLQLGFAAPRSRSRKKYFRLHYTEIYSTRYSIYSRVTIIFSR